MKVFLVKADDVWYDEFIGAVIVAESKEKATEIAEKATYSNTIKYGEDCQLEIYEHQYPITVEEVNMDVETIVLSSFNAG